jgi:phosphoribosylformylglycinamidine synthase
MGGINKRTMFNTCNMGIGMVLAVVKEDDGDAGMHIQHNPNGSAAAIEGITTRDGRISGKMTHAGRAGRGLYQNIPGNYQLPLFASAVKYFQ